METLKKKSRVGNTMKKINMHEKLICKKIRGQSKKVKNLSREKYKLLVWGEERKKDNIFLN